VGACDGDLSVEQILSAVATLLELDPAELHRRCLPVVRELLAEGWLDR
jgi:ubiquinone biosynthesis protein UbiJ